MTTVRALRTRLAHVEQMTSAKRARSATEERALAQLTTWPPAQTRWAEWRLIGEPLNRHPTPMWRTVYWQEWMGAWPLVMVLIDAMEDAAHGTLRRDGRTFDDLCERYNTLLARCPSGQGSHPDLDAPLLLVTRCC